MKVLVYIYAVSWIILLIIYIISLFQDRKNRKERESLEKYLKKDKKEKYVEWGAVTMMIIFAPLALALVPYILIKKVKTRNMTMKMEEERKEKENRVNKQKASCMNDYSKTVKSNRNMCGEENIIIAHSLQKTIKDKNYRNISSVLSKVKVPSGMVLNVQECKREGSGAVSSLFVRNSDGSHNYNIFENLEFEDTPMGAWQAYLLTRLRHGLPLWWHANYDRRDYIYTKDDIANIRHFGNRSVDKSILYDYTLNPEIVGGNGKYFVSCCFWTEFGGLIREYTEIRFANNKMESAFEFKRKTLFHYECGILF